MLCFTLQQEGSLCAQHCLNALLQGTYFTAVDLADIAKQLDASESEHMAEAGTMTKEYQTFVQVRYSYMNWKDIFLYMIWKDIFLYRIM